MREGGLRKIKKIIHGGGVQDRSLCDFLGGIIFFSLFSPFTHVGVETFVPLFMAFFRGRGLGEVNETAQDILVGCAERYGRGS